MRSSTCRAALPLAMLLAASAPGCDDGGAPGTDELHGTEARTVALDVEVTGEIRSVPAGSTAAAEASLAEACERFGADLGELVAPARVAELDCGSPRQLVGGSIVKLAATATARVTARVREGTGAAAFAPLDVTGPTDADDARAHAAWEAACQASLRRAKAVYGERLVGASCGAPSTYVGGSVVGYRSTATLWTTRLAGADVDLVGYAIGRGSDEAKAHAAWRASCDDWLGRTASLSGAERVEEHACGTPTTVQAGSIRVLASSTTARLRVRLADDGTPASEESTVAGERLADPVAAAESAVAACEAVIAARKEALGDRFLGGSCAPRLVASGSTTGYEARVTVWSGDLAPAEEPAPDGAGGGGGGGGAAPGPTPDPAQSQPAVDCMPRCLAMMDACDAGPREQTCEWMCADAPTEGELRCGEQTSCDDVSAWFNVCGLGS